jgi:ABC-type multidrug transport system permease subunit
MRLWTLVKKDGKVIVRSRLLLVTLVIYPLVLVGIIGYAFSEPTDRIPIAVLNKDLDANGSPVTGRIQDPLDPQREGITVSTSQLINGVPEAGVPGLRDFAEIIYVTEEEEGRNMLLRGEVQALVVFPAGFVDALTSFSQSATIRVIVDQSDVVRANVTEILVRGVMQELQERYVEQKVDFVVNAIDQALNPAPNERLYPGFRGSAQRITTLKNQYGATWDPATNQTVDQVITFLLNIDDVLEDSRGIVDSVAKPVQARPEGEKSGHLFVRDLIVPAALGLSIFWTGSLATSSLIVYEREAHAYRRLGITPTGRWTIVGSKVVLTSFIIMLQSLFILIAAAWAWSTRIDNMGLTLILIIASTFASIGLGIFLGGISKDVNGTVLLAVLTTFPMLFVSGLFYPVSFMPQGAQFLARLFPLTYTVEGLRGSMLRGFAFGDGVPMLVALLLFGVVLTVVGTWLGRLAERRTG